MSLQHAFWEMAGEMERGAPAIDDVPKELCVAVDQATGDEFERHDAKILLAEVLRAQRHELFVKCAMIAANREAHART